MRTITLLFYLAVAVDDAGSLDLLLFAGFWDEKIVGAVIDIADEAVRNVPLLVHALLFLVPGVVHYNFNENMWLYLTVKEFESVVVV